METKSKTKKDEYTELFTEYYHVVFNAVYPKVGNENDTEDICQEVFIALYNNLEKIESVRKWLFGTLKNIVYQYYRKKYSKQTDIDIDDVFQDVSLTFVNGFKDARIEISAAIEDEIKDETERMIVDLIAFHNYSYTYVAKVMGITKRTVQYRYTQLVKRILANLETKGIKNIEDLL